MPDHGTEESDAVPPAEDAGEDTVLAWLRYLRASKAREKSKNTRWDCFSALYRQSQETVAALYQDDEVFRNSKKDWNAADIGPADIERIRRASWSIGRALYWILTAISTTGSGGISAARISA